MTKHDKAALISSSLLAVLVIASVIVSFFTGTAPNQPAELLVSIGIILLSLFSIGIVFLTRVRRSGYEKKIGKEYFAIYQAIKNALSVSELSRVDRKEALADIQELILSAQHSGKPIASAFPDVDLFIRQLILAYGGKKRKFLFSLLSGCILFVFFIVMIQTLLWLEDLSTPFFYQRIDISMVVFCFAIAFFVYPWIRQLFSKQSIWAYVLPIAIGLSLVGILELLRHFFYAVPFVKMLLDGTIQMIPGVAALGIYLLLIPLLLLIKHAIRLRSLRSNEP